MSATDSRWTTEERLAFWIIVGLAAAVAFIAGLMIGSFYL